MEKIGEHPDAALLDLGRARILGVIDEVAMQVSAMIRCASGSIHVVTKVARLRIGSPSRARSSPTSRMASSAVMPVSGNSRLGTSSVAKRLPKSTASGMVSEMVSGEAVMWFSFDSRRLG
jgi:hypothetical protein